MADRIDLGRLRPARKLPDGRTVFDAHITRAGVFEYMNPDGSVRKELRPDEEVFSRESLDSFAHIPVTPDHPPEKVTAANATKYMVGATGEVVSRDDDHVRTTVMVVDESTLRRMQKYPEVSCGYTCDVVDKPGVHPIYGEYDAVQTNIRGNHLAVAVPVARAGSTARVRMDGVATMLPAGDSRSDYVDPPLSMAQVSASEVVLTSVEDGHQHGLYLTGDNGETSWSQAEGAESAHGHFWVRGADGTIVIGENAGHSHTIIAEPVSQLPLAGGDPVYDSAVTSRSNMKTEKDLQQLAAQLAAAEQRAASAEAKVSAETARADAAEGRVAGLEKDVAALRSERTDADKLAEKDAIIQKEKLRADTAEKQLLGLTDRIKAGVKARVALERKAAKAIPDLVMDSLTDREIMVEVVGKLHGVSIEAERSDDYARARFDAAIESHLAGSAALARLSEVANPVEPEQRIDSAPASAPSERWKAPLPSSKLKS